MTLFVVSLCGQYCRLHVEGQQ